MGGITRGHKGEEISTYTNTYHLLVAEGTRLLAANALQQPRLAVSCCVAVTTKPAARAPWRGPAPPSALYLQPGAPGVRGKQGWDSRWVRVKGTSQ